MIRVAALAALLLSAAATTAGDEPIPPDEWRRMTTGRTVYYFIAGEFFGREYYWPGTDMVTFQHASGVCADARWDYSEAGYCFYFDRPHCFDHVRRNGTIVIIPLNTPEGEVPTEQTVGQIAPVPFSCDPGVTS